jgi:uncharacterized membrane protein
MGGGIWSMHFIGMLAYSFPIRMSYDLGLTLLSLLVAITVSAFALRIVTRATVRIARILTGGLLMGLGVCSMHYMGMHAVQMNPAIHYDPAGFAASIAIAIVASIAALWLAFMPLVGSKRLAQVKKVPPNEFIGLAEEIGVIIPRLATGWPAAAAGGREPVRLPVPSNEFARVCRQRAGRHRMDATCLELEVRFTLH